MAGPLDDTYSLAFAKLLLSLCFQTICRFSIIYFSLVISPPFGVWCDGMDTPLRLVQSLSPPWIEKACRRFLFFSIGYSEDSECTFKPVPSLLRNGLRLSAAFIPRWSYMVIDKFVEWHAAFIPRCWRNSYSLLPKAFLLSTNHDSWLPKNDDDDRVYVTHIPPLFKHAQGQ